MEDYRGPHGSGLLVDVVEDESQEKERKDGLKLEVDEGKEHGRKNAGQPKRPGFGEGAVDETTEKEFFEQGSEYRNNEEGHGETDGIVAKEWKVGFLLPKTRKAEAGVIQNSGDGEGNYKVKSVTKQHGFYEQPRRNFFKTEVAERDCVLIYYKEPERKKKHHKLNEVLY